MRRLFWTRQHVSRGNKVFEQISPSLCAWLYSPTTKQVNQQQEVQLLLLLCHVISTTHAVNIMVVFLLSVCMCLTTSIFFLVDMAMAAP